MRLRNKVCIISGGAKGIGATEARLFAQEGAFVVIADILEEEGNLLVKSITKTGNNCCFVKLDVTNEKDWYTATTKAISEYHKIDILINNAGIYHKATVEMTTSSDWDRVMGVNATGVFMGTKAVIPAMKKAGGGSIVNSSSVAGLIGTAISSSYNASKGSVRLLSKSAALQYARDGIRVNSIHPGPISTDMLPLLFPTAEEQQDRMAKIPAKRFGTPEDVAYAALFLASDESSFMTGSELVVDGGFTAQ